MDAVLTIESAAYCGFLASGTVAGVYWFYSAACSRRDENSIEGSSVEQQQGDDDVEMDDLLPGSDPEHGANRYEMRMYRP